MSEDWTLDDELGTSREETRAAFENRAIMYAYIFEELKDELGPERAAELMKRAIHRRGLEVGQKYRAAGQARDLEEVGRLFCSGSPCAGALFEPAVEEVTDESITLTMSGCPLVEAWREIGLAPDEIEELCDIAAAVDEGTFERAGLELEFLDRAGIPGSSRCVLHLRVPEGR